MRKLLLVLVTPLFLLSNNGFSQPSTLGLGAGRAIFGILDTSYVNDSLSSYIWVKNYGPNAFSGNVTLELAVDTGFGFNVVDTFTFSIASLGVSPALDSIPYTFSQTYTVGTFNPYRIGGNIVVIWPACSVPAVTFIDSSLQYTVVLIGPSSVGTFDEFYSLNFYPNPVDDHLNISKMEAAIIVEKVRILDVLGKEIKLQSHVSFVNFSGLPEGTYFLEATFKNNYKKTFKIIKQNK